MSKNFKKMLSYYKPYRGIFWADMFFATVSAAVALVIPLVIRYVTYTLVYEDKAQIMYQIKIIAAALFAMVVADCYSKFFISNYGHVMGAKIEYNMRAEIFEHLQKLSFSFYDNQKVGQLMSRITTDLFDITELMHHGPENIILSAIKIIGAFIILVNISPLLALAAFIVLPFMFAYAYYLNGKMRRAFRQNRVKIAEINGQIEDNLSGIRVVKSFANEEIEKKKFKIGNAGFLSAKKNSYHYMGSFQAGLGAFTTLIQVNVILAGTILIANGKVNVSDLVTFVLYISVFTDPVRTLIDFTEQFQNGYSGFERFCEIMEIEPSRPAHDALGDAYHTALICARLKLAEGIAVYEQSLRDHENGFHGAELPGCLARSVHKGYENRTQLLGAMSGAENVCPVCGGPMRAGKWYAQPGRRYFTMAYCPEDGEFYLRVRIVPSEDGQLRANRLVYEPSEELNAVYEKLASAPKRRRPRRRKRSAAKQTEA